MSCCIFSKYSLYNTRSSSFTSLLIDAKQGNCSNVRRLILLLYSCSFLRKATIAFARYKIRIISLERFIRPWPIESIFHLIFSSTFDLKVERLSSVVEHMWPNESIFHLMFSSTFDLKVERLSSVVEHMWPNESIFHLIFSSTFDLKVERLSSVVEHMWPNESIFHLIFSSTFDLKVERLSSVVEHMWPNESIFT